MVLLWHVVNVAAIAAFVAAGFSLLSALLSVLLTARLTGRSKRQEWRREYVLPIVAVILSTEERLDSYIEAVRELDPRVAGGHQETLFIVDQIAKDIEEFDRKAKELELIASASVSATVKELYRDIEIRRARALYELGLVRSRNGAGVLGRQRAQGGKSRRELREDLIEGMRRDIGLPSRDKSGELARSVLAVVGGSLAMLCYRLIMLIMKMRDAGRRRALSRDA